TACAKSLLRSCRVAVPRTRFCTPTKLTRSSRSYQTLELARLPKVSLFRARSRARTDLAHRRPVVPASRVWARADLVHRRPIVPVSRARARADLAYRKKQTSPNLPVASLLSPVADQPVASTAQPAAAQPVARWRTTSWRTTNWRTESFEPAAETFISAISAKKRLLLKQIKQWRLE